MSNILGLAQVQVSQQSRTILTHQNKDGEVQNNLGVGGNLISNDQQSLVSRIKQAVIQFFVYIGQFIGWITGRESSQSSLFDKKSSLINSDKQPLDKPQKVLQGIPEEPEDPELIEALEGLNVSGFSNLKTLLKEAKNPEEIARYVSLFSEQTFAGDVKAVRDHYLGKKPDGSSFWKEDAISSQVAVDVRRMGMTINGTKCLFFPEVKKSLGEVGEKDWEFLSLLQQAPALALYLKVFDHYGITDGNSNIQIMQENPSNEANTTFFIESEYHENPSIVKMMLSQLNGKPEYKEFFNQEKLTPFLSGFQFDNNSEVSEQLTGELARCNPGLLVSFLRKAAEEGLYGNDLPVELFADKVQPTDKPIRSVSLEAVYSEKARRIEIGTSYHIKCNDEEGLPTVIVANLKGKVVIDLTHEPTMTFTISKPEMV